jgi:hypothetical protein
MTTPRDPKTPRKSGKSAPSRHPYKTPLARRLKYLAQDTGYALKKATRRVTDPVRDAGDRKPRPPRAKRPARPRTVSEARREPRPRRDRPVRRPRRRPRRPGAGIAAGITRFGERASRLILTVLAPVLGWITAFGAIILRALRALATVVTPLRAAVAVTALAAILLVVSQFVDYRGVAVGVPDYAAYSDVQVVAPAPQVDRQTAGSAHAYLLVPVGLIALGALYACLRGRWQYGRLIALLGALAIVVTLIVDVPAGLDEGAQAVAYAGVEAQLIEGFYVQLVSAAILVVGGLMVAHYARGDGRRSGRSRRRSGAVPAPRARAA